VSGPSSRSSSAASRRTRVASQSRGHSSRSALAASGAGRGTRRAGRPRGRGGAGGDVPRPRSFPGAVSPRERRQRAASAKRARLKRCHCARPGYPSQVGGVPTAHPDNGRGGPAQRDRPSSRSNLVHVFPARARRSLGQLSRAALFHCPRLSPFHVPAVWDTRTCATRWLVPCIAAIRRNLGR
jgi:hypothetical protein